MSETHYRDLSPVQLQRVTGSALRRVGARLDFGFYFRPKAQRFAEYVEDLGLGLYRVDRHEYLLGITEDSVHDHDRWLYLLNTKPKYRGAPTVSEVVPELALQPSVHEIFEGEGSDQLDVLLRLLLEYKLMYQNYAFLVRELPAIDPVRVALSPSTLIVALRYLGVDQHHDVDQLLHMITRLPELHTVSCHTVAWQRANPQFEGLPRELLLRSLGFARVHEANPWDWVSSYARQICLADGLAECSILLLTKGNANA